MIGPTLSGRGGVRGQLAWDGWNLKSIFYNGKQGESGEVIVYQAGRGSKGKSAKRGEALAPPVPSLIQDMQPPSKWGRGAPERQTASSSSFCLSSSFVRHQKCNMEWGTEEGLYLQQKNHGNFFAKNHDLTLRLHKTLQPNVHPTILT